MSSTRAMHCFILLMFGVLVMGFAASATAQTATGTVTQAAQTVNCSANYVGLTNKIAGCIRATVDAGAALFFTGLYPLIRNTIMIVMTLAVTLYGVLMAMGMVEKIGRDTFMLVIKLGAVSWFCASSPLIYSTVTGMMDSAAIAVVTYTPPSGTADAAGTDFGQSQCLQNMIEMQAQTPNSTKVTGPWLAMDCLIDTVVGIKLASGDPNAALSSLVAYNSKLDNANPAKTNDGPARALLFFLFSNMQSSIVGLVLAVIGFIFVYGFIMLVIKALFTYLAGYMGVAFLVIVSPIIIPLVLFTTTKSYFDKWVKLLISFTLQPVIMLVFIIFSLAAIDLAVFSGQYSIMYRLAGEESRANNFDLNAYLTKPRMVVSPPTIDTGNPPLATSKPIIAKAPKDVVLIKGKPPTPIPTLPTTSNLGSVVNNMINSKCTPKEMAADATLKEACDASYPIQVWKEQVNWDLLAAARTPPVTIPGATTTPTAKELGQQVMREVLASTLFCGIVVFILNGLLAVIPAVATDLLGDFGLTANMGGVAGQLPTGKGGVGSVMGSIASSFKETAKGLAGTRR
ncbi:MAG: type IV secretion system protein [Pseudomonadota bacterium]